MGMALASASALAQQSDIGPLKIERIGPASALLSWPDDPETFLQESSDLGWLNDWSPSLLSPLVIEGERSVVVPLVDEVRYFRLSEQAGTPNRPPVMQTIPPRSMNVGGTLELQISATDPDQNPIVYGVLPLPLPPGSTFDATTGRLVFRAGLDQVGQVTLTLSASDGYHVTTQPLLITVNPPPVGGVTALSGLVLDTTDAVAGTQRPIAGVRVSLLNVNAETTTDAAGRFTLNAVPAGKQVLDLDTANASLAPDGSPYAGFREEIQLIEGIENVISRPLYLPRVDVSSLTPISPNSTTIVRNDNLGITLSVAPQTAQLHGAPFTGSLSISLVPNALAPAALPDFLEPGMLITIQPVGVSFTTPAPITFPNLDQLPPGTETDLWSLDAGIGQFVIVGKGRVSPDGQRIDTISGGIRATDWHAPLPPPPPSTPPDDTPPENDDPDDDCDEDSGSTVTLVSGVLSTDFVLPQMTALGRPHATRFVYRSDRAWPRPVLPGELTLPVIAAVPDRVSVSLNLGGVIHPPTFIDTSALNENVDETFRVAVEFDATHLPTGAYPYALRSTSHFASSRISSDFRRRVVVVNHQESAFGSGWGLDGLARLHVNADQSVLLTDGDGSALLFSNPDRRDLFVQNAAADGILRFDGETGQLVGPFVQPGAGGLKGAHNPIFGPDGHLYVKSDGPRILRFDGATGRFLNTFVDSGTPGFTTLAQMAWGPDGHLYTDLAGTGLNQVYRWHGQTGAFLGVAASGQGIQRICGIAFGADGLLYVADQDRFAGTRYDRILRFNGATGAFIDVFVPSGNLEDTCPFEFGIDGDIYIADQWTRDIRRFSGANGGFTGIFASGPPITNPVPFYARSGPDGLLYIANGSGIHRYRDTGTPGTFVDTFVSGATGFFTFTPEPRPNDRRTYLSPNGDPSVLVREPDGRFTRHFPHGVRHEFSSNGWLEAVVDRHGNLERFEYDTAGRLLRLTNPAGGVTTLAYLNGRLGSLVDPAGRQTRFTHDDAGNLARVTFPDGTQRAFGYDERHLMVTETHPDGGVVQREFDAVGRLARAVQPDGSERSMSNARSTALGDPASGVGSAANPLPVVRSASAISRFVDGGGMTTEFKTGPYGEGVRVVGPDGGATQWERDENGHPTKTTLPSGHVVDGTFDEGGNPLVLIDRALGNAPHSASFDPDFQLFTSSTNATGQQTRFERDVRGNITAIITPLGRTTRLTYDPRGLALSATLLTGSVQTNAYDAGGRLSRTTQVGGPSQRVVDYEYTAAGDLSRLTDSLGAISRFEYDPMGRLARAFDPSGSALEFDYNQTGLVTSVRRDNRSPHRFRYTLMGSLAEYLPPGTESGAGSTRYHYNAAQQLVRLLRADGREVLTTYDAAGRMAAVSFDGATHTFAYSPSTGQLTSIAASGQPTVAYEYSGERVTSATWSGAVQGSVRTTYNALGLVASVRVNSLPAVAYAYDNDGLLRQAGELTIVRQPATGLVASATLRNVIQDWEHNEFGELIRHRARFGVTLIVDRVYQRDSLGRITSIQESRGAAVTTTTYSYDAAGRLTLVTPENQPAKTYAYDANGNRTAAPGLQGMAVYDVQDRLTAYGNLSVTQSAEGEMLRRESAPGIDREFTYDALGRLRRSAVDSGPAIDYIMDGRGRWVGRRVNGVADRGWLYSDAHQVAAELDASSVVRSVFVNAFDGAPDAIRRDGRLFAVIKDHLGSPTFIVDADSGGVAQELRFDEFGVMTQNSSPGFQPFGFAGGLWDEAGRLVRFGERWYDAEIGRWTSRDPEPPLDEAANLYLYARNDPVNHVDRDGNKPVSVSSVKDPLSAWATDQAMQSIRDSIRNIHELIKNKQLRINEQNGRLRKLRQQLAKARKKKEREILKQQIKNTEEFIRQLEQEQRNLHSDLALAYRALNAIKFGKWVPDNAFDPRNWLDPHRARFKPEW